MTWFLKPESLPEKFGVMILAILLFAVVMGLVLAVVDRPKLPKWTITNCSPWTTEDFTRDDAAAQTAVTGIVQTIVDQILASFTPPVPQ